MKQIIHAFDELIVFYEAFKLYNIGECYLVLGNQSQEQRSQIKEVFKLIQIGLDMIECLEDIYTNPVEEQPQIGVKIGIHSGNCIAGIIRTDIMRYDIYGQNVQIAKRIHDQGVRGKVHISEQALQSVKNLALNPELVVEANPEPIYFSELDYVISTSYIYMRRGSEDFKFDHHESKVEMDSH